MKITKAKTAGFCFGVNRAVNMVYELLEKGESVDFDDVKADMIQRDKNDSTRECSPLIVAEGATVIDTSDCNFDESVEAVISHIRSNM